MAAAITVADAKGMFKKYGIKAKLATYKKGGDALDALLSGAVDVGTCGMNDIIFKDVDPSKQAIVASLAYTDSLIRVLARRDKGINTMADLKGKTIGTVRATYAHYCLCFYLIHQGLDCQDINLVFMSKKELPEAIASGAVDAICQHGAPLIKAKKLLGDNWQIFESTDYTRKLLTMLMRRDLIEEKPEIAQGILRAILEANAFIASHPDESIRIVAESKGYTEKDMAEAMSDVIFETTLNQSLLISFESVERWAIESQLIKRKAPRNYLRYIDPTPLRKVSPELVTIIR
jgi:ABC-type nitrate/sulfonate/bicarbonate transport system substrate-binding protein